MRLTSLFAVIVVDLIGFGIVMPILPFYAQHFGASATLLGLLLASYAAMQFIFAPIWGRWSDRIGRKRVLMMTILGGALSLLVLGLADSLLWIFVGRILSGVFGANISVATAYITDVTDEKQRASGMGLIGAAFGIGFVLGPAIGGLCAKYGYHLPILIAAALTALNLVTAWWGLQEPPRHVAQERIPTRTLLAHTAIRPYLIMNFVFIFSIAQLESIFAFWMMDRFGYDAHHVAYLLVFTALIMAAVQGGLIRRLSHVADRRMLLVGMIVLAASLIGLTMASALWVLLVVLAGTSLGRGLAQPAMLSLISKQSAEGMRGSVMGLYQSAGSFARIFAPAVAGALYDTHRPLPFLLAGILALGIFLTEKCRTLIDR